MNKSQKKQWFKAKMNKNCDTLWIEFQVFGFSFSELLLVFPFFFLDEVEFHVCTTPIGGCIILLEKKNGVQSLKRHSHKIQQHSEHDEKSTSKINEGEKKNKKGTPRI